MIHSLTAKLTTPNKQESRAVAKKLHYAELLFSV